MTNITVSNQGLSHISSFQAYLHQVNSFPMLTEKREQEYGYKVFENNDKEAAKMLIQSHLRLVVKIAAKFYKNYGLPIADLVSEGNVGLIKAVKKFDPTKGFRLSTYAILWIKSHIQEYVLKSWSLVKVSSNLAQKKLFFSLSKIKNILNKKDDNLSINEIKYIADNLNVRENEVVDMSLRLMQQDYSLNNVNEFGEEFSSQISSNEDNQEEIISKNQDQNIKKQLFLEALCALKERERDIVKMHRINESPKTLKEISQKYKISKERVRQIEEAAINKIKKFISQRYQCSLV
jgi:RNA polymerase sigma-32 factor